MQALVKIFYTWYRQAIRNSKYRWLVVIATLLYWIIPADVAPDFIPLLGWLDDGVLATLLISEVSQALLDYRSRRREEVATEVEAEVA
jgi:uncharacterized membrane protein YkvA (DUF1232 family)